MTRREFRKNWNNAKQLHSSKEFEKSIEIYQTLIPVVENIESIFLRENYSSDEHYENQMCFEKALFFRDFIAPLCDGGFFEKALEISQKALYYKEKGSLKSLLYIFYNTGNIHLGNKDYTKAIEWYDKALYENETNRIWLNEKERADYYTNKGIALYFMENYDEAEKWFLNAINVIQNYKNFEPFYFLSKIYQLKKDEKLHKKYHKMFITRKTKMSDSEFKQRTKFILLKFNKKQSRRLAIREH